MLAESDDGANVSADAVRAGNKKLFDVVALRTTEFRSETDSADTVVPPNSKLRVPDTDPPLMVMTFEAPATEAPNRKFVEPAEMTDVPISDNWRDVTTPST